MKEGTLLPPNKNKWGQENPNIYGEVNGWMGLFLCIYICSSWHEWFNRDRGKKRHGTAWWPMYILPPLTFVLFSIFIFAQKKDKAAWPSLISSPFDSHLHSLPNQIPHILSPWLPDLWKWTLHCSCMREIKPQNILQKATRKFIQILPSINFTSRNL